MYTRIKITLFCTTIQLKSIIFISNDYGEIKIIIYHFIVCFQLNSTHFEVQRLFDTMLSYVQNRSRQHLLKCVYCKTKIICVTNIIRWVPVPVRFLKK